MTDRQRMETFFDHWAAFVEIVNEARRESSLTPKSLGKESSWVQVEQVQVTVNRTSDEVDSALLRRLRVQKVWVAWRSECIKSLRNLLRWKTTGHKTGSLLGSRRNSEEEAQETDALSPWPGLSSGLSPAQLGDVVATLVADGTFRQKLPSAPAGDAGLRPSFCENIFESRKSKEANERINRATFGSSASADSALSHKKVGLELPAPPDEFSNRRPSRDSQC